VETIEKAAVRNAEEEEELIVKRILIVKMWVDSGQQAMILAVLNLQVLLQDG
jgi:NADH pyrophosphatase NudC (nudix superfamily)